MTFTKAETLIKEQFFPHRWAPWGRRQAGSEQAGSEGGRVPAPCGRSHLGLHHWDEALGRSCGWRPWHWDSPPRRLAGHTHTQQALDINYYCDIVLSLEIQVTNCFNPVNLTLAESIQALNTNTGLVNRSIPCFIFSTGSDTCSE